MLLSKSLFPIVWWLRFLSVTVAQDWTVCMSLPVGCVRLLGVVAAVTVH